MNIINVFGRNFARLGINEPNCNLLFSRPKIEKYFHTEGKMKDNIKWDVKMKPIAMFVCEVKYLYNERVI